VGGAPSSNKGWKSCFFFISYRRGWSFSTEWISRTVNNSVPALSVDETELIEILREILSSSRGVKDMKEAWLVEVGLSPAPRGMFLLSIHCVKYFTDCTLLFGPKVRCLGEYLHGALHPTLVKQAYECSSKELMNKVSKSVVWTEAMTLLEAELKDEGAKAVVAYKASRGFESGLEKMGWVSYEFGYRVVLERL
ncbi:hypothetical protein BHM03_00046437, partial [Ensete ventricosum]